LERRAELMVLLRHELRINLKSLLLWSVCVGFTCFGCIWLFGGLEESMTQMAEAYGQMGAFSAALGLDRISVSTMEGFYATEVALIYAIGGAMFGAMTGVCMLAKEEEGHTSEFLNTLPLGRSYLVLWKFISMGVLIVLFNLFCIVWELAGFALAGEALGKAGQVKGAMAGTEGIARFFTKDFAGNLLLFHQAQLLMHLEVGSICFLFSALCRKKQVGAALGFSILLYVADLMCRMIPELEKLKYVTPYYFSNGTDIFTGGRIESGLAGMGALVTAAAALAAFVVYGRKDLAA